MKIIGYIIGRDGAVPEVSIMADSSLLKDGKPFFVPDFASRISIAPAVVFHISRLGKNIARKFARRYYDSIAMGAALKAEGIEGAADSALHRSFDGSAVLGEFVDAEVALGALFSMSVGGKEVASGRIPDEETIASIIEYLSRYMTFKIGDLIYCIYEESAMEMQPELHFSASIGETKSLLFKSK